MLPAVGRLVSFFFSHSRFKSQDRAAIPAARARYVVFPLGTDCDTPYFQLAPASARIVGVRSEQSRTVPQAVTVRSIPPGTHPVSFCVDPQGQGKTRRFAQGFHQLDKLVNVARS